MNYLFFIFKLLFLLIVSHAFAQLHHITIEDAVLVHKGEPWLVVDGEHPLVVRNAGSPSLDLPHLRIAGGAIHFESHSSTSVHGTLINEMGVDGLVLLSCEQSTASLIHYTTGVEGTIKRYIPAVNDWYAHPATDWHMLSSPVVEQPIIDFIPESTDGDYDFYGWCEESDMWINYKQQSSFIEFNDGLLFIEGRGYLVAYEMDQLFSFRGELQASDIESNNLTYTGESVHSGWHLVGNPYPSALNWNNEHWERLEVHDEVHVWDKFRGNYVANNNGIGDFDGIIMPHQGMFVKAIAPQKAASLNIPAAARQHQNTNNNHKKNKNKLPHNTLRLEVRATNTSYLDASYILLRNDGKQGFDERHDAHKLRGSGHAPELFTEKAERQLSIHSLPFPDEASQIPLWFCPGSFHEFTINTEGVSGFDADMEITLIDLENGHSTNLHHSQSYSYTETQTGCSPRFLLEFNKTGHEVTTEASTTQPGISIYGHQHTIYIDLPCAHAPASLQLFDINGRLWITKDLETSGLHSVKKPKHNIIFVARVTSPNTSKTKKIPPWP